MTDFSVLPDNLPVPQDDGAADHLPGQAMPSLTLKTSDDAAVNLGDLGPGRTVIYLYPLTGRPGTDLPAGWDTIPGARGCTGGRSDSPAAAGCPPTRHGRIHGGGSNSSPPTPRTPGRRRSARRWPKCSASAPTEL